MVRLRSLRNRSPEPFSRTVRSPEPFSGTVRSPEPFVLPNHSPDRSLQDPAEHSTIALGAHLYKSRAGVPSEQKEAVGGLQDGFGCSCCSPPGLIRVRFAFGFTRQR